jgi:hypothetical protein
MSDANVAWMMENIVRRMTGVTTGDDALYEAALHEPSLEDLADCRLWVTLRFDVHPDEGILHDFVNSPEELGRWPSEWGTRESDSDDSTGLRDEVLAVLDRLEVVLKGRRGIPPGQAQQP